MNKNKVISYHYIIIYRSIANLNFCLMKIFSTKISFTTKDFLEILYEMMMNELRPSLTSGGVLMNKTKVLLFR